MTDAQHAEPDFNPYASPKTEAMQIPINVNDDALRAQLRAFVGPNAAKYLYKWAPALSDSRGRAGFNFAAFFLSGLWLSYRKMYKAALIFYVAVFLVSLAAAILDAALSDGAGETLLDRIVSFGAAIVCGAAGNGWYLAHARRAIATARAEGLEGDALLRTLSARGGTNLLAALGVFGLFMLAIFAMAAVAELLAGGAP